MKQYKSIIKELDIGLISQQIQTRPEMSPQALIIDKDKYKKKDIEEDLLKRKDDKSVLDSDKKCMQRKRIVSKWESVYITGTYYPKLQETVVKPEDYIKNIYNVIEKIPTYYKQTYKNLNKFALKLNFKFRNEKIKFEDEKGVRSGVNNFLDYGINEARCYSDRFGTIIIYLNPNVFKVSVEEFIEILTNTIKHELVHRGEFLRINSENYKSEMMRKDHSTRVKYLSDKHEIMAYAWSIVEEYKIIGFNRNKILNFFRHGTEDLNYSINYQMYRNTFEKNDSVMKLLYKYIYMYLDED
jgi:hypothetical protein